MKVGTKSVLYGVHCFFIHPIWVFLAWWKLYGFPSDPRLWVAFLTHDLGYWGCENMDGPEGERHPIWAAKFMTRHFGYEWGLVCLCHSRFFAKQQQLPPSPLCFADKLVPSLEPWWFYLPRAWASGELWEYLKLAGGRNGGKYKGEPNSTEVQRLLDLYEVTGKWRYWYRGMALFSKEYALAHKDGRADTWTLSVNGQHDGSS